VTSRIAPSRPFHLAAATLLLAGCASTPVTVATTLPATPPTTVVEQPAAMQQPPALGPVPELKLPPVVTRTLANGMTLMVVEHKELPIADFVLLVRSGFEADPADRTGLAGLTAAMLDEGAGRRNALDIADQQAFLGVSIGTGATWDYSSVSLHTPTAQLDSSLALFADIALRPTFPETDFERVRRERLTALLQYKDRAPQIADVVYANTLYGSDHPYGRSTFGTEASVRGMTRAEMQRFYQAHYRPNNATLVVVGDVNPADIEQRINRLFGAWQRAEVREPAFASTQGPAATTVYLVDKPGAAQSSVRIGSIGVARSTEDFFPLMVMNTILGGSFSSRLMQNLRETHGYTYGASSGFSMRQHAGPFTARGEIVAAKTDSALIEFMKELRGIHAAIPEEELSRAKQYVQLQMPAQFETTGGIASQLIPIAVYGLPVDYYNSYVRRIGEVTQADVNRVARKYLDPSRMAVVVVGDRQQIEPAIRALNLGPVTIRGIWGETVTP
jgi:zinc protease